MAKRDRISFDPKDPAIRKALDLLLSEEGISPGDIANYGTVKALIELLTNPNSEARNRLVHKRGIKVDQGLAIDDLIKKLKQNLDK